MAVKRLGKIVRSDSRKAHDTIYSTDILRLEWMFTTVEDEENFIEDEYRLNTGQL